MSKFPTRGIPLSLRSISSRTTRNLASFSFSPRILSPQVSSPCNVTSFGAIPAAKQFMRTFSSGNLPKHIRVAFPALSPTMEMGTVVSWHKKEGDQLSEGDLLCDIETDKATMGFDTPEEGFLAKIFFPDGSKDVPIGKLLCIIVENEDDVKAFANYSGAEESGKETPASGAPSSGAPKSASSSTSSTPASDSAHGSASLMGPAVRLLIHHYGIKEQDLKRSGPKKNILKEDVMALVSSKNLKPLPIKVAPPAVPKAKVDAKQPDGAKPSTTPVGSVRHVEKFIDIPLTNIRKVIAKRLSESKQTIPHQYVSASVTSNKLNAIRKELKTQGVAVSVNDFIVKASAVALRAVPEVNVQWRNEHAVPQSTVDVSVAVATPNGLITPIVFGADALGITAISDRIRTLAKKARENKLTPQEFQGGTFTISNLGMFGSVTNFTAIINPPQAAFLAVGGGQDVLTTDLEKENRFLVTLCFDGRAVSPEAARRFLSHLTNSLSDPEIMLAQPIQEPFDFDYAQLL